MLPEASSSADRDEEELPDEFYEFTEADLHRVLAAQATSRVREAASAVLKTKEVSERLGGQEFGQANIAHATANQISSAAPPFFQLRAREAREREAAQAARTTHIIVEFPDGYCLQTAFLGGDRLTALHSLVKRALLPGLAEQFSLFLTPPRVVLQSRQGEATLASAGLVPAARVHVSLPDGPGAGGDTLASRYLRPDVLALTQQTPPPSPFHREAERAGDGAHESGGANESALTAHADPTSRASNVRAAAAPHKASGKGPKWLKLGRP